MLPELVADEIFGLLLVFVRVGAALMLLPGFGEPYVLACWRLLLAFWLALALAGPLASDLPALPAEPATFARLIGGEALLGLFTLFIALLAPGVTFAVGGCPAAVHQRAARVAHG